MGSVDIDGPASECQCVCVCVLCWLRHLYEQHLYILINPGVNPGCVCMCYIMSVVVHVNDLTGTKGFVLGGARSVRL